eukprot:CAMPEP_0173277524 /NCGR_PEP_ID=MMETSP1143-20121109/4125_1 /TAXON_ID=483371 /ORGANISM="non described non described, Strain CCMP2298" /LENGTH=237 /DNA_ID=CAMNT_0014214619 /DNA_START=91 /DNA_END=806 /DNA_ORIENTATION=-
MGRARAGVQVAIIINTVAIVAIFGHTFCEPLVFAIAEHVINEVLGVLEHVASGGGKGERCVGGWFENPCRAVSVDVLIPVPVPTTASSSVAFTLYLQPLFRYGSADLSLGAWGFAFRKTVQAEVRFTACNSSFFSTKSDATNTVITQTKLVEKLAAKTELPKTEVLAILRALAETVNEEVLINGVDVRIAKLGTFKRKELLARKGRNPKTGEELDIMPKNSVKFMASSSLKESPSTA